MNILIVENDPRWQGHYNRMSLIEKLREKNHESVVIVSDRRQAEEAIKRHDFSVAVTDLYLDDPSDMNLVEWGLLAKELNNNDIPIIVVSAFLDKERILSLVNNDHDVYRIIEKDKIDIKYFNRLLEEIIQKKNKTNNMNIPQIISKNDVDSYILALDTVDFSSEEDSTQLACFEDIINMFTSDENAHCSEGSMTHLFTGDGLLFVFGGVENKFRPLDLGISILNKFEVLRKKEIRLGINSGPLTWVGMSNNTIQLIGNTINWAVRVMDAAENNSILISDGYHNSVVRPNKTHFSGFDFIPQLNLKTKKDEPIAALKLKKR